MSTGSAPQERPGTGGEGGSVRRRRLVNILSAVLIIVLIVLKLCGVLPISWAVIVSALIVGTVARFFTPYLR